MSFISGKPSQPAHLAHPSIIDRSEASFCGCVVVNQGVVNVLIEHHPTTGGYNLKQILEADVQNHQKRTFTFLLTKKKVNVPFG